MTVVLDSSSVRAVRHVLHFHNSQKNICSSKLCKAIQATMWLYRRVMRKTTRHFCRRTCARRFWSEQRQESSVYVSLVSPLDQNPDPKYKPHFHLKNHPDLLFVIDVEAAQNSLEVYQTANRSALCYDTVLAVFLTKIIHIKDGAANIEKATKESGRDRNTAREILGHKSQDQ